MASNPQVQRMLKEMLESGKTPEEVCRDCPELLPEIRQRWRQFQHIDGQVRSLLPGLATRRDAGGPAPLGGTPTPPAAFGRYQVRGASNPPRTTVGKSDILHCRKLQETPWNSWILWVPLRKMRQV